MAALCYLCAASGLLGWQGGLIFYNILCASALLVIFDALGWPGNRLWRAALALGSAVLAYFFVYRFDAALDHTVKLHCFALYFLLLLLFVLAQTRQGAGQLRVLAQNGLLFGTLFLLFVIIYGIFLLTAEWLFDIKHLSSENIALFLYQALEPLLHDGRYALFSVEVRETDNTGVIYYGADQR